MRAKIQINLKHLILNGYSCNFLVDISIYEGSLLHSHLSFKILCQYSFKVATGVLGYKAHSCENEYACFFHIPVAEVFRKGALNHRVLKI